MGQRDDACLASIGTTIDFHDHIGYDKVEGRMIELATKLKIGLHDAGVKLVTPMEPNLSGGVCIIDVPAPVKTKILNAMYDEHGIAGSTAGASLGENPLKLERKREYVENSTLGYGVRHRRCVCFFGNGRPGQGF